MNPLMLQVLGVLAGISLAALAGISLAVLWAEGWGWLHMRPASEFWKKRERRVPDEELDWCAPFPKSRYSELRDSKGMPAIIADSTPDEHEMGFVA